jgi:hypothetical protein
MGPMQEIMDIIHTIYRRRHLDAIGKYYIYRETSTGKQTSDNKTTLKNRIFDLAVHHVKQ